jgi:hypothetical protein
MLFFCQLERGVATKELRRKRNQLRSGAVSAVFTAEKQGLLGRAWNLVLSFNWVKQIAKLEVLDKIINKIYTADSLEEAVAVINSAGPAVG